MSQATWEPAGNLPPWAVALYENRHPKSGATAEDFDQAETDPPAAPESPGGGGPAGRPSASSLTAPADWTGLDPGGIGAATVTRPGPITRGRPPKGLLP